MRISKDNFSTLDKFFLFQEVDDTVFCSDRHKEFFPVLVAEKPRYESLGSIKSQNQGLLVVGTIELNNNFVQDVELFLESFSGGNLALVCRDPLEVIPYCEHISDRVTLYFDPFTYENLLLTFKNLNEYS